MTGVEWVIDARGCDAARLTDQATLAELFDGIVDDLSARRWHAGGMFFREQAGSPAYACSRSRTSRCTFPEHGSLCLNVFCCRPAVIGTPRLGYSDMSARAKWTCGASNAATGASRSSSVSERTADCPNCGAAIAFRWSGAVQTSCGMRLGARAARSRSRKSAPSATYRRRCPASSSAPRDDTKTTGSLPSAASSTSTSAVIGASGIRLSDGSSAWLSDAQASMR